MRKDARFVAVLSFLTSDTGEKLGEESCDGRRDAKEHAAHLAATYGSEVKIANASGEVLAIVGEEYLDALAGW